MSVELPLTVVPPRSPGVLAPVAALVVLVALTAFTADWFSGELRAGMSRSARFPPSRDMIVNSHLRQLTDDVGRYTLVLPGERTYYASKFIDFTQDQVVAHRVGTVVHVRCDGLDRCVLAQPVVPRGGNLFLVLMLLVIEIGAVIGAVVLLRGRLALRATLRGEYLPVVRVRRG